MSTGTIGTQALLSKLTLLGEADLRKERIGHFVPGFSACVKDWHAPPITIGRHGCRCPLFAAHLPLWPFLFSLTQFKVDRLRPHGPGRGPPLVLIELSIFAYPAVPLFLFSLTLLCPYFYFHLPCCALIFFALTLLCPYFPFRLPCCAPFFSASHFICAYPAVALFYFVLTLLCV